MPTNTRNTSAAVLVTDHVNLKDVNRTSTADNMSYDGGSIASPGVELATTTAANGNDRDHEMILPPKQLHRLAAPNPFTSEAALALDTAYLDIELALDAVPNVDASIDANVWVSDGQGGVSGGDLVDTAVQDVDGNGTATVTYTFAFDVSGVDTDDVLQGYFRVLIDDTGGANNVKAHIYDVAWRMYERG